MQHRKQQPCDLHGEHRRKDRDSHEPHRIGRHSGLADDADDTAEISGDIAGIIGENDPVEAKQRDKEQYKGDADNVFAEVIDRGKRLMVLRTMLSVSEVMRRILPAAFSRAVSVMRIPAREQRIVDGKNSVGRMIASKIPNWLNASAVEFPACRNVIGTSASLAELSREVSAEPAMTGTAARI